MSTTNRRRHAASFAIRRAWELLPTPNAHPSQRERDESEVWLRLTHCSTEPGRSQNWATGILLLVLEDTPAQRTGDYRPL